MTEGLTDQRNFIFRKKDVYRPWTKWIGAAIKKIENKTYEIEKNKPR